ncbi:FISUMP domain-containing protein [Flavivirga eckloniae]|uniref:Fibronectin type-III domain-containing protein n=1 Tax=Flavivirga eckloniae TaxID=1803846 RepID=A0A2K9PV23_9FLAO|nr:FISUMP domain-containing protein [Flavivirga eckloniae]AUP80658.1 hypothetical protein C1H87_18840 [Flavivirga eckloniae]
MKYIDKILLLTVVLVFTALISCEDDEDAFVEQKPSVSLVSPADKADGIDIAPSFEWQASDPNSKPLKFDFLLGLDSTKLFVQAENLKEMNYSLTDYKILKEEVYYWRVVVKNGTDRIESDIWEFKSIPAPDTPNLIGPDADIFIREALTFEWEPVAAGEGETISYKVLLGKTNPPTEVIATIDDGSTSYTADALALDIGDVYYWKVDASDLINDSSSEVRSFKKLQPGAPDEPMIVAPENRSGVMAGVTLDWTDVTDPEGDAVSYDVYLDKLNSPVTLVATVTDSEYTPTGLDINSAYYWYVVAKDPSNNASPTIISGFANAGTSPGFPDIQAFAVDGVLSLDEKLVWGASSGATSYDVYIDTVNPPVNLVAADITETEYLVKNSEIPSDITDVKTYYALVVAKDGTGGITNSFPVEFTPQMTGTMTDTRAQEVNEYTWVRIGEQVWMSQNLRAKKLTNGEDIAFLGPRVIPLTGSSTELYFDESPEGIEGFTPDWQNTHGRVYSSRVRFHPLAAPTGWHVMTNTDLAYIRSYVSNARDLMGTWHDGATNLYGLNCVIAGYRYDNSGDYVNGFRTALYKGRAPYWVNDPGSFDVLELYPTGTGFRFFDHPDEHLRMFGIRLVKDE